MGKVYVLKENKFKTSITFLENPWRGEENKFYFLYEIKFPNDKYYRGKHTTNNLYDGYAGSGSLLPKEYASNDINLVVKIVHKFYKNNDELNCAEKEFIGDLFNADSLCVNLTEGGNGGKMSEEVYKIISTKKKGVPRSKESIEKQRISCTGKKHSEETKRKMSEIRKSMMTDELKEKIRQGRLGKKHTNEAKEKIRNFRLGKPSTITEEGRKRISDMLKNRVITEKIRENMSNAQKGLKAGEKHPFYGKKFSEEHKNKISLALKGKITSEETKNKISKANMGKKRTDEVRKKCSEHSTGVNNPNFKNISVKMLDQYTNELIKIFENGIVAEEYVRLNVNPKAQKGQIYVACRENRIRYGFKWEFNK